jgi:hypothetical protein
MSIGFCPHCRSKNTKISYAYPSDFYCLDCKKGGDLSLVNTLGKDNKSYIINPHMSADKRLNIIEDRPSAFEPAQNNERPKLKLINHSLKRLMDSHYWDDDESYNNDSGVCDYE